MTQLTAADVRAILPQIDEEDIADILQGANADNHETIEWLPYYKLALGRLAQCAGTLRAVIDKLANEREMTGECRKVLEEAANCYRDHLVIGGLGPAALDSFARLDAMARIEPARQRFLRP